MILWVCVVGGAAVISLCVKVTQVDFIMKLLVFDWGALEVAKLFFFVNSIASVSTVNTSNTAAMLMFRFRVPNSDELGNMWLADLSTKLEKVYTRLVMVMFMVSLSPEQVMRLATCEELWHNINSVAVDLRSHVSRLQVQDEALGQADNMGRRYTNVMGNLVDRLRHGPEFEDVRMDDNQFVCGPCP